jgi:hypothetical protein
MTNQSAHRRCSDQPQPPDPGNRSLSLHRPHSVERYPDSESLPPNESRREAEGGSVISDRTIARPSHFGLTIADLCSCSPRRKTGQQSLFPRSCFQLATFASAIVTKNAFWTRFLTFRSPYTGFLLVYSPTPQFINPSPASLVQLAKMSQDEIDALLSVVRFTILTVYY